MKQNLYLSALVFVSNLSLQAAKLQKKWLLVNIQADGEFDCHRLNRDVWKDEMVQNIIACNCIFWQVSVDDVLTGHHPILILVCHRGRGGAFFFFFLLRTPASTTLAVWRA